MGGDLTIWVKCPLVGHSKIINYVSKQTHPGDRSRQNILTFNIKSHKKCLGIVNFIPRIQTMYCIQIPEDRSGAEIKIKSFRFSRF
jgi:hypothetical protein